MPLQCAIVPVTPYVQNCSILMCTETKQAAVVDPGGDLDKIVAQVKAMGATLSKILLTHGHLDHCAGADTLRQQQGVNIEGPHKADSFWIDQLPMQSQMMGFGEANAFESDRWLDDNDTVTIGNVTLEVIFCPGHTPGHVVFYSKADRLAVVGDVLFQGSIGRTDFPMSDHQSLIDAITQKLWPLGDDITFIPGHGPTSTFGQERKTNPFVADPAYR